MSIFIFTNKKDALKKVFPKTAKFLALKELSQHEPDDESISYIDVLNLDKANLMKNMTQIKKVCKDTPWGIIDPKGSIKDTASLFFDGACDYLGHGFFKDLQVLRTNELNRR